MAMQDSHIITAVNLRGTREHRNPSHYRGNRVRCPYKQLTTSPHH